MALPALAEDGSDIMVRGWLAPLLEMARLPGRILPMDGGFGGWRRSVGRLREGRYEEGVLMTPSFSAAWLFRWGGVARLRGTETDGRSWLLMDGIPRTALHDHHRINQYRLLAGQDTGRAPMHHTLRAPEESMGRWRGQLGGSRAVVGLFPGSNAPSRRWPADRFADLARRLQEAGHVVVVLGGRGEQELTHEVARRAPGALDLGGRTDLPALAGLLSSCGVVVTNDTGPMHLAAALGVPTVSLWGPSDPREVAPPGAAHRCVGGPALPCRPCFKNHCPRSGPGTMLSQGHEECMRLIEVDEVSNTVEALLEGLHA
jgi:heptosyltransferase-2